LIYKRLKEIGQLDRLKELKKPKNWRSSLSGQNNCAAQNAKRPSETEAAFYQNLSTRF
jgi:hypothetical protein